MPILALSTDRASLGNPAPPGNPRSLPHRSPQRPYGRPVIPGGTPGVPEGGLGREVSVVVASRDRPALLTRALASLAAVVPADVEVLVVDSASRTPQTRRVAESAGRRCLRVSAPGASRARNAGLAATTTPIVAFTDDDCEPEQGWVMRLAAAFADPRVGFATGRVLAGPGRGHPVSVLDSATPVRIAPGEESAVVGHSANLAVRRAAWTGVGGFDEVLGAGGRLRAAEDQDLLLRLVRAGWAGCYVPEAVVAHRCWRTRREVVRLAVAYGCGQGALAVKWVRLDGRAALPLLRAAVWQDGVGAALRDARSGYELGVLCGLARAAGAIGGGLRAARRPLDSTARFER